MFDKSLIYHSDRIWSKKSNLLTETIISNFETESKSRIVNKAEQDKRRFEKDELGVLATEVDPGKGEGYERDLRPNQILISSF